MSDYLPPSVRSARSTNAIFELERKLGKRPEFAAVARYTHCPGTVAQTRRSGMMHEQRHSPVFIVRDLVHWHLMPAFRSGSASPTSAISPAPSATAIQLARIVFLSIK